MAEEHGGDVSKGESGLHTVLQERDHVTIICLIGWDINRCVVNCLQQPAPLLAACIHHNILCRAWLESRMYAVYIRLACTAARQIVVHGCRCRLL